MTLKEKTLWFVAGLIPRAVVNKVLARVAAKATTGRYGDTIMSELTLMEAMERYNRDDKNHRFDVIERFRLTHCDAISSIDLTTKAGEDHVTIYGYFGRLQRFTCSESTPKESFLTQLHYNLNMMKALTDDPTYPH